jgi:transposase
MNIHKNARLTPRGRVEAVCPVSALGQSARQVARALQVSDRTIRKWVARGAGDGVLADRICRPARPAAATAPAVALRIKVLRHQYRLTNQAIAHAVGVSCRCAALSSPRRRLSSRVRSCSCVWSLSFSRSSSFAICRSISGRESHRAGAHAHYIIAMRAEQDLSARRRRTARARARCGPRAHCPRETAAARSSSAARRAWHRCTRRLLSRSSEGAVEICPDLVGMLLRILDVSGLSRDDSLVICDRRPRNDRLRCGTGNLGQLRLGLG